MTQSLFGCPVVVSTHLPNKRVQVRIPRSKKKRIRRKWSKDSANFRDIATAWMIRGTYYVSPAMIEELRKKASAERISPAPVPASRDTTALDL